MLARAIDRVGRRAFVLATGAAHVVLCGIYATIERLTPAVYVLRATHGVVEAIIFSILFAYAAEVVPASRRTEGIAWFGVSAQLPIALGGLVGDFVLARAGYASLFMGTSVLAALGLIASLPLDEQKVGEVHPAGSFIECATQRDLLPLWFIGIAFATAIAPVFIFLKTYVLATGIGSVGLFLALYSLSAAALRLFFGWVPDRVGPKKALGPAILAVAVGMWLIARARTGASIGIAGMLAGAGHGLAFPVVAGLVVDRARPPDRSIALSLVASIFDVGQLIGGPLFGAIIVAQGYGTAFAAAALTAAIGLVVFTAWDRAGTGASASAG
jgi:predicted MFS family arabinose efflux permease